MKKSILSLVFAITFMANNFAQATEASVTFFTQNGERIWVIINGQRQNDTPQTNVKVTGLTEDSYRAKIIFQDERIADLDQNLWLRDVDNKLNDVVYNIRPDKKGNRYVIRMVSFKPATGSTTAEQGQTVVKVHDLEPVKEPVKEATPSRNPNADIKVDTKEDGSIKQSITITDENGETIKMDVKVDITGFQSTTDIEVRETNSNPRGRENFRERPTRESQPVTTPAPVAPVGCTVAASTSDFNEGLKAVKNESFSDNKLNAARQFLRHNCVTTDQVRILLKEFSFEETRLEVAKMAYDKVTDKNRYFTIANEFSFSSTKSEFNSFLDSQ
jgi:flagellar basal body rod protein FlgC